jgi:hypothetical protein
LRTNVDCFIARIRWTGGRNVNATVLSDESCSAAIKDGYDDWDFVRVQFSRPLIRKQTRTFTLRLALNDERGAARPFFQKFIDDSYPNGMTLRVVFDSSPKRVLREIFLSHRTELPLWQLETKPKKPADDCVWVIKRPMLGRRYRISWECESRAQAKVMPDPSQVEQKLDLV